MDTGRTLAEYSGANLEKAMKQDLTAKVSVPLASPRVAKPPLVPIVFCRQARNRREALVAHASSLTKPPRRFLFVFGKLYWLVYIQIVPVVSLLAFFLSVTQAARANEVGLDFSLSSNHLASNPKLAQVSVVSTAEPALRSPQDHPAEVEVETVASAANLVVAIHIPALNFLMCFLKNLLISSWEM